MLDGGGDTFAGGGVEGDVVRATLGGLDEVGEGRRWGRLSGGCYNGADLGGRGGEQLLDEFEAEALRAAGDEVGRHG